MYNKAFFSIVNYIKNSMKRCTAVIEWLTHATNGDFQYKGNFNESAVGQALNAIQQSSKSQFIIFGICYRCIKIGNL